MKRGFWLTPSNKSFSYFLFSQSIFNTPSHFILNGGELQRGLVLLRYLRDDVSDFVATELGVFGQLVLRRKSVEAVAVEVLFAVLVV
eukprot:COSAG01_NODE_2570_length_7441_cov_2.829202_6_plen_87_part_00